MQNVLVVGLGGFCGALARYGLAALVCRLFSKGSFAGTLTVNALGCLLLGLLAGLAEAKLPLPAPTRLFLVVGVLGSFTTFSAVSYETFEFLRSGQAQAALLHSAGGLVLGLAAVAAGWGMARSW